MPIKMFPAILVMLAVLSAAGIAATPNGVVGKADAKLFIKAHRLAFTEVADELQQHFGVEIKGLENLTNKKITFDYEAVSLEELIRGLLRYLNIKNYAFEFAEDKLKTVNILPGAVTVGPSPADATTASNKRRETVTVAVIKNVVESSQAEALDLRPGDVIVEYDGNRIHNATQLVEEVNNKSNKNQIDMLVVREGASRRLVLQGGFIGVRITTEKVSKKAYLNYF